ncbi:HAD family hydrolase [Archangium lansingense]|uniref:HAD-IB family hydrolase n=1 Tax=Archangium lansingense TaxID=2995310 RepID=A0ABT4AB46_9BACT|nr:HAD-IB family hydrolase [Archangium lansinium]MCY1078882.1 HAD-IB family hydrolase [Archangium lansinium]
MYAFFDVDGTLLSLKSMFSFQEFYLRWESRGTRGRGEARWREFLSRFSAWEGEGRDRLFLNREYYRSYAGRSQKAVRAAAAVWFSLEKQRHPGLLIAPTLRLLREHQGRGHVPVFVSGSLDELLEPLARELGVTHCLATRLKVREERYTGEIDGPQMIGQGKADAVRTFLAAREADSAECFAYGDHSTDVPMLEAVGHPVAVIGDPRLAEQARRKRWEMIDLNAPPSTPPGPRSDGRRPLG